MKKKKQTKESSEIEKLTEYQEHIYNPWHYVDGKIHPAFRSRTKVAGIAFLGVGLFYIGTIVLVLILDPPKEFKVVSFIGIFVMRLLPGFLFILAGVKVLRKHT